MTTPKITQMTRIPPAKETKDLGAKFGEAVCQFGAHQLYASLVTNQMGGFNVAVSTLGDPSVVGNMPFSEIYLFPQPVSEEEARARYSELR